MIKRPADIAPPPKSSPIVDTLNRDGAMAVEARKKGTGVASAEFLPGVRLVRAFNAISYVNLGELSQRIGLLRAISDIRCRLQLSAHHRLSLSN